MLPADREDSADRRTRPCTVCGADDHGSGRHDGDALPDLTVGAVMRQRHAAYVTVRELSPRALALYRELLRDAERRGLSLAGDPAYQAGLRQRAARRFPVGPPRCLYCGDTEKPCACRRAGAARELVELRGAVKQHRAATLGRLERIGPAARALAPDTELWRAAGLLDGGTR